MRERPQDSYLLATPPCEFTALTKTASKYGGGEMLGTKLLILASALAAFSADAASISPDRALAKLMEGNHSG